MLNCHEKTLVVSSNKSIFRTSRFLELEKSLCQAKQTPAPGNATAEEGSAADVAKFVGGGNNVTHPSMEENKLGWVTLRSFDRMNPWIQPVNTMRLSDRLARGGLIAFHQDSTKPPLPYVEVDTDTGLPTEDAAANKDFVRAVLAE